MSADDGLPPLREVVRAYDLAAKRSLGQNFLFDLNLTGRIARAAGPLEGVHVVEIGPGPGGLTRALLGHGTYHVTAIERDDRCARALADIADRYPGRLSVVQADALKVEIAQLQGNAPDAASLRVVANLPYNISTALLAGWLEAEQWPPVWDRLVLMFQKEVAQRIVATPRERADYGRLSILCAWRTQTRILFDVPPTAFTPPPNVTSSIVELRPRPDPLPCSWRILSAIAKAAFGQRRKMLRQSLKSVSVEGKTASGADLLKAAGVPEQARADELDLESYVRLANAFAAMQETTRPG